jgi:hypothetical protein
MEPHAARVTGRRAATAVMIGLLVGGITAYGQGWVGDSFGSAVNSAGPWSVAAFLVARPLRTWLGGAASAAATLAMCEVGYVIASNIRGVPYATSTVVFWLTAAALAGPPLGVAAVWSRDGAPVRTAAGFGVICGVLIGEGSYGLARLTGSTNSGYWLGEIVVGVVILGVVLARTRSVPAALAGPGVAAACAGVVFAAAILA